LTHLPQQKATETATKSDVVDIRTDLRRLEDRFDALQALMHDQLKTYTVTMIGAMTALTAIFGLIVTIIP